MIADNKLTENGAWNEELLANHFVELSALDLNFSLDVTGFEIGEIDLMIESQAKSTATDVDTADDLRNIPSGPPMCKPGDIWLLGRHRILLWKLAEISIVHDVDGKRWPISSSPIHPIM